MYIYIKGKNSAIEKNNIYFFTYNNLYKGKSRNEIEAFHLNLMFDFVFVLSQLLCDYKRSTQKIFFFGKTYEMQEK